VETRQRLHFLGLGFERGQRHRGLALSPERARRFLAELPNFEIVDHGDERIRLENGHDRVHSESELSSFDLRTYRSACEHAKKLLRETPTGEPCLFWGGDHSVAISTVGAFCDRYPEGSVLWIDAHADLNLPRTSVTGNLHGMPLALLMNLEGVGARNMPWLKRFLNPERLIYLGLRDLDPFEEEMIARLPIRAYRWDDVKRLGMERVACEIHALLTSGARAGAPADERSVLQPLHVSFDIDSLDPLLAPSTGVPVSDGLTLRDLEILSHALFERMSVRSVDVVEVNPALGSPANVEQTYRSAMAFVECVFAGQRLTT
jgi:arginase